MMYAFFWLFAAPVAAFVAAVYLIAYEKTF